MSPAPQASALLLSPTLWPDSLLLAVNARGQMSQKHAHSLEQEQKLVGSLSDRADSLQPPLAGKLDIQRQRTVSKALQQEESFQDV